MRKMKSLNRTSAAKKRISNNWERNNPNGLQADVADFTVLKWIGWFLLLAPLTGLLTSAGRENLTLITIWGIVVFWVIRKKLSRKS